MRINVVVLMAGEGSRFKEVGYPMIKPFIEVNDKHILEWTTRSLNFIKHYDEDVDSPLDIDITFAIQRKHNIEFQISDRLKRIYGEHINIVELESLTRGNLETAYIATNKIVDDPDDAYMVEDYPILFLDSDNYYDGSLLYEFINQIIVYSESMHFGSICCFDPLDNSSKWCFAGMEGHRVKWLSEKDSEAIGKGGKPMVGTFFFSSGSLFLDTASYLIKKGEMNRGEFYMSQCIQELIDFDIPVYAHKVDDVIPMGTPDDIIKARKLLTT